jgi:putative PEP-CTERM system TPR-repeat lipoprotein
LAGFRLTLPRVALAFGLLVVAVLGYAALRPSPGAGDQLRKAEQDMAQGAFSSVVVRLRSVARVQPDNVEARYQLGLVSLALGDGASAEKDLKVARDLGRDDLDLLGALTRAYLMQGKHDEVLRDFQMEEPEPRPGQNGVVLVARGFAHLGLRQPELAEGAFRLALESEPRPARAHLGLAWVELGRQHYQAALQAAEDASAPASPASVCAEALAIQAELRQRTGDLAGATQAIEDAIAADPFNVTALTGRVSMLLEQGRLADADRYAKDILARFPKQPTTTYLRAMIVLREQGPRPAYDFLVQQGEAAERYLPSMLLMGRLEVVNGQLIAAQSRLETYLEYDPDNALATLLFADILIQRNFTDKARVVLQQLALQNDSRAFRLLARSAIKAGRAEEASEWFDRLIASAPTDPVVRSGIAYDRLNLGQVDAAAKDLETVLSFAPESLEAKAMLVVASVRQKKFAEALQTAAGIKTDLPDSPLGDNLIGGVRLAQDDLAGAQTAFEAALRKDPMFMPALNLAKTQIQRGDGNAAAQTYEKIVAAQPMHLEALMRLAEIARMQGRADRALLLLAKARDGNPEAWQPRLGIVNLHLDGNKPELALAEARRFRFQLAGNPEAFDALGRAQVATRDFPGAIATYHELIAAYPNLPQSYERLARIRGDLGETTAAQAVLREGLQVVPDSAALLSQLALAMERNGELDAAIATVRSWSNARPRGAVGHLLLGDLLSKAGKTRDAHEAYARAFRLQPLTESLVPLALAKIELGDSQAALALAGDWLRDRPDDMSVQFVSLVAEMKLGKYADAISRGEQLLRLRPDNPQVLNNLAWLYGRSDIERGLATARRAFALAPEEPDILDTLGFLLVRRGDVAAALPFLEKGYEKSKAPDIGYHLATAYARAGRSGDARTLLTAIIAGTRPFDERRDAEKLLAELAAR